MVALGPVLAAEQQVASVDEALWHRVGGVAQTDEAILKKLVEDHHRWTGSLRAREILDHWAEARGSSSRCSRTSTSARSARSTLPSRRAQAKAARTTISKARVADAAAHAIRI